MSFIDFSKLYCPFPSKIHKHANLAQKHITEWAETFRIANHDQFERSPYARIAARAYPHLDKDNLFLAAEWLCWVFVLDDEYDKLIGEDPQKLRTLLDELIFILEQDYPVTLEQASPLAASLSDIWIRLLKLAPPGWITRYKKTLTDYFEAAYWEAINRKNQQNPKFDEYMEMRPYTSGCYTVFDLIEITEQLTLSEEILTQPSFQRIYYLANITACLMNDLFSYNKEKELGDIHNVIHIFQREKGLTTEEAITKVIDMHNRLMEEYIHLQKEFPSFGEDMDKQIQRYFLNLNTFLRSHYDWSLYDTDRYLGEPSTRSTLPMDKIEALKEIQLSYQQIATTLSIFGYETSRENVYRSYREWMKRK